MREVSVQAANDTNNDQDRKNLQAEMNALITEIDRIAGTTTWAGEKLMEDPDGSPFSFQVGAATGEKNQIAITIDAMGSAALGLQEGLGPFGSEGPQPAAHAEVGEDLYRSDVTGLKDGGFVVTGFRENEAGSTEIYAKQFDAAGEIV